MKQLFKFTALLMAVAMMVVACAAPETPANMAEDTVNVSFQFPEPKTTSVSSGSVDSVLISSVFFQYKAENVSGIKIGETLEWTNLTSDEVSGLGHTLKLGRGVWNVSLRGFATAAARTEAGTAETAGTKAIFDGELTSFSVGDGSTVLAVTADVPLEFTNNTGKGSCTVTVTFDEAYAGVANKKATVRLQSGEFDQTNNLTFGETGTDASDAAEFTEVDNGIATITVDYLDEDGTPFGDTGSATTLIMTDMHTTTTATISMDVVKFTINGSKPEGSVEDNVIPKVFNSIFDIYPDNIADNAIVIGYAEETKALDQTPITYPYEVLTTVEKDAQGRYTASSLGLTPIVVTSREDLNTSGATEAWYGKNVRSSLVVPNNRTLEKVRFVDGITSIGNYLFKNCSSVTSITIPDSVTKIGESAFYGCSSLTSITIPDSVTTIGDIVFYSCSALTSITIPDGISSIGSSSFYGCTGLTLITIPSSVTSIGSGAFSGCTGLTSITIPNGVTSIGHSTFEGCSSLTTINIPNSVTSISHSTFRNCKGVTSITIPDNVTYIGENAFWGCNRLTSITIPDNVTTIGAYAFRDCSRLTSITIPDGVTSIGESAFSGCSGLTSITIPASVTSISPGVFRECSNLTSIMIPDNVTTIGSAAFYGCTGLTSITISNGVTSIENQAFSDCTGVPSITIPNSVISIGDQAFYHCNSLTSVIYEGALDQWYNAGYSFASNIDITCQDGKAVYSIGKSGNNVYCYGLTPYGKTLTSVTIPDFVTIINNQAFENYRNMTSMTIPNSVTSIGSNAFQACSLRDIYVNQAESDTLFAYARVPSGCTIHWNSTGPESV